MRHQRRNTLLACGVALAAVGSGNALAQDFGYDDDFWGNGSYSTAPTNDHIRLKGGIGIMALEANEYVYSGSYTVSRLIWTSTAPVLRGSISFDVGGGVSLEAEGSVAAYGVSSMEDYDWLGGDDTFDNWTHRSQHPDTRLEHYWTGAASIGYDLLKQQDATVRVRGGLKYTDVKWSAYGGSYVYSVGSFRDTTGTIPDGTLGITYQQQLPEVFVGVDGEQHYGDFRVGAVLRGGLTARATATDNHWLRNLKFVDSLDFAATLTAGLDLGYRLTDAAEVVVAARYEQVFQQRGTTNIYDQTTGALIATTPDSGAGELRTIELTAGLHGAF